MISPQNADVETVVIEDRKGGVVAERSNPRNAATTVVHGRDTVSLRHVRSRVIL